MESEKSLDNGLIGQLLRIALLGLPDCHGAKAPRNDDETVMCFSYQRFSQRQFKQVCEQHR